MLTWHLKIYRMKEKEQIHFNVPQLRSLLIGAPNEYLIAGRGTGKSEGVLAPKTATCYFDTMPRSAGVIVGATYNQLLTRTLPALIAGWEKIGYRMGIHYLIGKTPSAKWIKQWEWEGPYRPPLKYEYFISWWNGAGAHLVSQDRQGNSNGMSIDWIGGDEAKLLNRDRLKTDLIPANRGIIPAFNENPYHHGMTLITDMPIGTAGRWILDMESQMDKAKVKSIIDCSSCIYKLRDWQAKATKKEAAEIEKQIKVFMDEIMDLRHNLLLFHEASTLENIHALGLDFIKQMLRENTRFQFDTQILNLRPLKIEDGFYPDFNEEMHGYFNVNNSYLEKFEYDFEALKDINCLRDGDRDDDRPLHIAIDYNRRIHPMVVAQDRGNTIQFIKGLHSLYPKKLKDVLNQFIEYYKPHKRKFVYYWFDHTATGEQHETAIYQEVVSTLSAAGWIVEEMYTGKAPNHEAKYRMWGHLLQEDGIYNKKWRINRENCSKLIISMCLAQAEKRLAGFGKNKKSEHDENFPAEESTHYSDAGDMIIQGMLESGLLYSNERITDGGIIMR